jgi:hypothetical protein
MTRKALWFPIESTVVTPPAPAQLPTISFQQLQITALVGDNIENLVSWGSLTAGQPTLVATPPLEDVTDLDAVSGSAFYRVSNVQLSAAGVIEATIDDAGGSAVAGFTLIVQVAPTISVADPTLSGDVGETLTTTITWGDADASVSKPIASITSDIGSVDTITDQTQTAGTARWILTNASLANNGLATITITDADGLTATATVDLTITSGAPENPTLIVQPFFQELPVGSEAQLTFRVTDPQTTVGNPYTSFQIMDGGTDISSRGIFSPTADLVDVPTEVSVSWSTSDMHLVDDGDNLTVRVTDGDGNVTEASIELIFNVIDPLKTLPDHQVQRTPVWSVDIP